MMVKVNRAVVITRTPGTDLVRLITDLPSPFPPEVDDTPLALKFETQRGHGVGYVQAQFPGLPIEVLDIKTGDRKMVMPPGDDCFCVGDCFCTRGG
jgi:hypothetical protein